MRTVLSRLYNVRTVQNVDVGAGASILESVDPALDLRDDPQLCGDPNISEIALVEALDIGVFRPCVSTLQVTRI